METKETLIVIDPDTNLMEDLQRRFMLEPDFKIIDFANSGTDGLNKIKQHIPNFAVISFPLPDIDVLQAINSIKSFASHIKIIVTLEVENPSYSAQCMQAGVNYVINKPYSADKLIKIMGSAEMKSGNSNMVQPNTQQMSSIESLRGAMEQFAQQQQCQPAPNVQQTQQNLDYQQQPMYQQQPYPQQPQMQPQMRPYEQQYGQPQGSGFRTIKQMIIAVNCPKGGVGKTTMSKELASAYSTVRIGGQPLKVCIVDCDLDFGDIASMLKVNSYPNISHWTSDIAQKLKENPSGKIHYSQQEIENKYMIIHPTGLRVLAAPSSHTDALDVTGKEVEIIIDSLKTCNYDIIILDTGNNTKDYTLISLDKANVILMVTTLDVTTINDTNLLLNTLRSIQFPMDKIKLVVNRMPKTERDIDTSEISQVLRTPIIGIIPDYPRIRQLNNSGTPAVLGKENEFTAAVRQIGNKIVPVFNKPINPSQKKKQKNGFFAKLFGK